MDGLQAATQQALSKPGFVEEALPWLDAVYRFALRLEAGDVAAAEDLAQDTFVRAYNGWATYTPGTNVRSWLFTICRNLFLRRRSHLQRTHTVPISDLPTDPSAFVTESIFPAATTSDPQREFFDSFLDAEVQRAVDDLPLEFREAVVLSDVEGLTYNEIAELLAVPLGTVKSRLYRGRRLLAEKLYSYAVDMGYIRGGAR